MKTFLINLGVVVVGYICFSVMNMGVVLLLFRGLSLDAQVMSSLALALSIEVVIIGVSSYWMLKVTLTLLQGNKALGSYILLSLLIAITALNIYLNQSVEPLAYKLLYVVVVIAALVIHKPWHIAKEQING